MEIKITIQEIHIHIDGGAAPKENIPGGWKEILLQAVKETDHVIIDRQEADKIASDAKIIAPGAKKLAKNAKDKTTKTKKERKKNFVFGVTESKQCGKCNKDFKPRSNGQKYCDDCGSNKPKSVSQESTIPAAPIEVSSMGRPLNTCKQCGQKFEPVKNKTEAFCSPLCKQYYIKEYNKEWYKNKSKKSSDPKPQKDTASVKKEVVKKSAVPSINERPARIIPSGMSGEELKAIKDKERVNNED